MATQPASLAAIQAAKAGDDAAFERLLEPLLNQAYRLAAGLLHDHQAAEDAVQEAAFKAWRKLSQLREGSEMRPWFLAIVANQCRSSMRSRWRSTVGFGGAEPAIEASDDEVVARVELRRALRSINQDQRLVLVLHFYLDLPVGEIAPIIGISPRGAETRLLRATNELKRRMEAHRGRT